VTAARKEPDQAAVLRDAMTDKLIADGWIASPVVEKAFRAVPRELFAAGHAPLETVYDAHEVVRIKRGADGTVLSSVSAPWMQARMIAQAGAGPGMRVLEIGSGGCNAALLAEVVDRAGHVVSVDIDPEVTAPAWLTAVAPGGTLVVPLRMNGVTRSAGFRWYGDHLVSTSVQTCGFVPVQGASAHTEQVLPLSSQDGRRVVARFEDHAPASLAVPADALSKPPVEAWSDVTIGGMTSFADLFLWCAGFLPGFCKITVEGAGTVPSPEPDGRGRFPCACARRQSFAWLTTRTLSDGKSEFGARARGPHAGELAGALLAHIREWDRHGRNLPGDAIAYWPAGTYRAPLPGKVAVFRKACGTVTITWPPARDDETG
jgi:protein-L-isoaspartate(D-aspartate) O-methyltransferase